MLLLLEIIPSRALMNAFLVEMWNLLTDVHYDILFLLSADLKRLYSSKYIYAVTTLKEMGL